MSACDKCRADSYLDGSLSAEEAIAFELHMLECESCQAELLSRTANAGSAVNNAVSWDRVPERVNVRVQSFSRPRSFSWVWAATAAAASLAIFFAVRGSTPNNVQPTAILLTSQTPIIRPGGTIRTRGIARVRLDEARSTVTVVLGSVEVTSSTPGALVVRAGAWTAPIKGRCLVEVSPNGEVSLTSLGESIAISAGNQTRTLGNGHSASIAVWEQKPAADDPFALASREPQGTPSFLAELARRMKVPAPTLSTAEDLSSDELAALERANRTESLANVVAAAKLLAAGERTEGATLAVGWALDMSPSLAGVSLADRRVLAAGLARDRGDLSLAAKCADLPALRDWKRFIDAWKSLPEYPSFEQREAVLEAAQAISATTAAEKLALAEGVGFAGRALAKKGSDVRWEPGLRESARLGNEVALDPDATDHQRAMGYHAVSESVNFLPGGERDGLKALMKAIEEWRRPHWLVHYAARAVEHGDYERNFVAGWAIEGLAGDPTWESFDSAIKMLRDLGIKSKEDQVIAKEFTVWVADLFASVPDAQKECGSRLEGWYQAPEAKRIRQRYQLLQSRSN